MRNKYLPASTLFFLVAVFLLSYNAVAQLSVNLDVTMPACYDYTDGSIQAVVAGGTAPYYYHWSNNQHGEITYGVSAGEYSVTVTDETGATATAIATVQQPVLLIAEVTPQGEVCAGNNGAFLATGTGGTPPYTYLWSNGETSASLVNPDPDYYFLTVTDANGCLDVAGLKINGPLTATVHTIDVLCPLWCDGSAEAIISGGTGPYSFLWNTGATTQVIFPLPPGIFSVTVTDGNSCTAVASGQVTEPPVIVLDVDLQNPCSGSADVTVSATGGTPPFTYEWSNGQTGPAVTGLAEGVYFVSVTDAKGCKKDQIVTVSNGAAVVVANAQNATCTGVNNGSASAVVTSGIGPLSYVWSNGETTPLAVNLGPGTYTVTVTDGAGCTDVASVNIGATTALSLSGSSTAAGCAGASLGTATVSVISGGVPPYSYQWNDSQQQTTQAASNLAPGTYGVTVTDAQGCQAAVTVQVSQSNPLAILVQATNTSCHNTSDGSAKVAQVSNNAVPPLSYLWSNGSTEDFIENVLSGIYAVTVTDAQGCTGSVTVSINANATLQANFEWKTEGCPGDSTIVSFTPFVNYSPESNPVVSWKWVFSDGQTANIPNPIVTFTHSPVDAMLIVENTTGCKDIVSQTLDFQSVFKVQIPESVMGCLNDTIAIQPVSSAGDSLVFEWISGNPAISILDKNEAEPRIVAQDTTSSAVVYLTVQNSLGCIYEDSVKVMMGAPELDFDLALVKGTQCDGLTVNFSNANPFAGSYQWYFNYPDTTATSTLPNPSYTYVDTGTYTVALVSLLNCVSGIDTFSLEVGPPPAAGFSFEKGICSDSITISFTDVSTLPGNIAGWLWEFSNGDTSTLQNPSVTLDSSQLFIAELTIRFGENCTANISDTIDVKVFSPVFLQDTAVACLPNPSAELNPGGDDNLVYQWSPANGLDDPESWNPVATVNETTTYTATILDSAIPDACSVQRQVTVFVPEAIDITPAEDVEVCIPGLDTLFVSSTTVGVSYLWSSQTDFGDTLSQTPRVEVQADTIPATFFVKITDRYGCAVYDSARVGVYPVKAQVPDLEEICLGESPNIIITGLMPGDLLTWTPTDPNMHTPQDTTDYQVLITNQYGCERKDTVTVKVIDLNKLFKVVPALDTIIQGESVELSVIGDFVHQCTWMPEGGLDNPSDCDPTASPLISTIYKVEVEDPATGCRGSGQSEICVVSGICGEPLIFVPNAFTPNGDGLNDVLYVRGYNIERVILFAIYNRWGEKVFESHSVNEGWDGDYKGRTAKGDVFAYYLKVECQTGEEFFKKGNVTVIR
jgi:gliding motility-associated-like protein